MEIAALQDIIVMIAEGRGGPTIKACHFINSGSLKSAVNLF